MGTLWNAQIELNHNISFSTFYKDNQPWYATIFGAVWGLVAVVLEGFLDENVR